MSLEALFVEVNRRRPDHSKWIIPRTVGLIAGALAAAGIESVRALGEALAGLQSAAQLNALLRSCVEKLPGNALERPECGFEFDDYAFHILCNLQL